MLGCGLEEVYPVVPLADRHAISIGLTTIGDGAFFGIYADPESLPDVEPLATFIDESIDELLSATSAHGQVGDSAAVTVPRRRHHSAISAELVKRQEGLGGVDQGRGATDGANTSP